MADNVINLRTARKRKARADKDIQSEQNRISFGRTKSEKTLTTKINKLADKKLDQKKLTDSDE